MTGRPSVAADAKADAIFGVASRRGGFGLYALSNDAPDRHYRCQRGHGFVNHDGGWPFPKPDAVSDLHCPSCATERARTRGDGRQAAPETTPVTEPEPVRAHPMLPPEFRLPTRNRRRR